MSYQHIFYAIDLERLRAAAGSGDLSIVEAILEGGPIDDGELEALRQIIAGDCRCEPGREHLYGYALKRLCEHLGEMTGGEVADVRDHPYRSRLLLNGPPIPIPYDEKDFPQIGHLSRGELAAEYRLATETAPKAKKTLPGFLLRKLSGGVVGREMSAEDVAEDMAEYAETLRECQEKNCDLVSFRH